MLFQTLSIVRNGRSKPPQWQLVTKLQSKSKAKGSSHDLLSTCSHNAVAKAAFSNVPLTLGWMRQL
jgi:hypothetical protein